MHYRRAEADLPYCTTVYESTWAGEIDPFLAPASLDCITTSMKSNSCADCEKSPAALCTTPMGNSYDLPIFDNFLAIAASAILKGRHVRRRRSGRCAMDAL